MKKKMMLSLIMIICMMLLINVEASAATSKTTIGYPETSLYNKNDPNLVPLELGMDLSGRTVYFNTKWNIYDYIPDGYMPDSICTASFRLADGQGEIGDFSFQLTDDAGIFSYLSIDYYSAIYNVHYNEGFEYGNSNNWLMDSFYFSDNRQCIISEDVPTLEVCFIDGSGDSIDITIKFEDLMLVTKEPGQLISTSTDISGSDTDITDLEKVLIIGALICMGLFILRSIKR